MNIELRNNCTPFDFGYTTFVLLPLAVLKQRGSILMKGDKKAPCDVFHLE